MGRAAEAGLTAAEGHYAHIEFRHRASIEGFVRARRYPARGFYWEVEAVDDPPDTETVTFVDPANVTGIIIAGMERDS